VINTAAGIVLFLITVAAFNNYRRGTLPEWFGAKFLGRASEAGPGQALIGAGFGGTVGAQVGDVGQGIEDAIEQVTGPGALVTWRGATLTESAMRTWKAMVAAAEADGVALVPGSTYRSRAAQEALRRAHGCGGARLNDPSCKGSPPTAVPGRSLHEQGLAVDVRNCSSRDTAAYKWLAANAERFGWKNLPSEPWHWSTGPRAGS
jgi:D-alanyl-D-alanine carboxypeptidase